jgi:hypothetical protein
MIDQFNAASRELGELRSRVNSGQIREKIVERVVEKPIEKIQYIDRVVPAKKSPKAVAIAACASLLLGFGTGKLFQKKDDSKWVTCSSSQISDKAIPKAPRGPK